MRDNTVVIFRAYIQGLNENVKPNWSPSQFIGRSEPVYNYTHSERDVNFTLKLMAGTKAELKTIYRKLNKLTSMAYPEYQRDSNLNGKVRMKPPLAKLRYGDLYNSSPTQAGEQFTGFLGFISSITYTIPDSATYEIDDGMQVPKYIEAAISFNVIHSEVPNKNTKYFGANVGNEIVEGIANTPSMTDPFGNVPGTPALPETV